MNFCESLIWSEFDCIAARATEYLENKDANTEKEAFEMACQDTESLSFEYDEFLFQFDSILHQISESGFFFVEGRNIGWRHLSAQLNVTARNAIEFISKAFPKTSEWTLRGSFDVDRKILEFFLHHHDAPTGEFYIVSAR